MGALPSERRQARLERGNLLRGDERQAAVESLSGARRLGSLSVVLSVTSTGCIVAASGPLGDCRAGFPFRGR